MPNVADVSRNPLARYMHWLHTRWPAGTVERLPEVREDGSTNIPGLYVVGDLTGIPLLKFSADTGARVVAHIVEDPAFQRERRGLGAEVKELVIIGAGVSGMAAALAAQKAGLRYVIYEATQVFSTVANFPKGKPIYTYPKDMVPAGDLHFHAEVKESLLGEMQAQTAAVQVTMARVESVGRQGGRLVCRLAGGEEVRALRVIVAIGRSGNFRKLNVPGEDLDKVYNRLHDPRDYAGQRVLVVGGGDSALETAIALVQCGADVTLSYRKAEFARPKPDNLERIQALAQDPAASVAVEHPTSERVTTAAGAFLGEGRRPGRLRLLMPSEVKEIRAQEIVLTDEKKQVLTLPNDVVFSMIGREAPLAFLRRSGLRISGEWTGGAIARFALFFLFCFFVYTWKADTWVGQQFKAHGWFPFNVPTVGSAPLLRAVSEALQQPGFYYSLAYCVAIVLFGIRRIRRRRTPYVKLQTLSLMAVQLVPLFLLPYLVLPWMGHAGVFAHGLGKEIGDNLFPDGSYWRSFGFILAWPLFVWNLFNWKPLTWWLAIGLVQTFVLIPLLVYRYGKGAYCGWICSCGALAETLGDEHRGKMPHGPAWNRLNMVGQAILAFAMALLLARTVTWYAPQGALGTALGKFYDKTFYNHAVYDYYHVVDIFLAGVVGVGLYFWFSGRVWCRFACPLAALMHIYARFSRFRIFADKKKCISCNVCTSVCHMGIDIMNFANKGLPMEDPQCVRCSACVQSCPTGVLSFGRLVGSGGKKVPRHDQLAASLVQIRENPAARKKAVA